MSFPNCRIGDKEVEYLTHILETNLTITEVKLNMNNIGAKGVKFPAESLKKAKALNKLDLDDNQIDNEGAQYLAEILKHYRVVMNHEFFFYHSDLDLYA
ncbi:unnamed protein product, partial [Rotaria sp. Silwood1]